MQYLIDPNTFTTVGSVAMAIAFAYKSMAFGIFAWILWQQKGTSLLSTTGRDMFAALFGMAFLLMIVFTLASIDRLTMPSSPPPVTTLGEFRNVVRNLLIATVVGVVIYGSRFMDAVFQFIREQYEAALEKISTAEMREQRQDATDVRQDNRDGEQDGREVLQNSVEKEWRDDHALPTNR